MPVSNKQLKRLIRFSAQLKENRYPNCSSFVRELRDADVSENISIACTGKTVYRDIELLKKEFGCPVKFDRQRNGYYLAHHGWELKCPQLLDENEMLASVIGARVAEHLFPEPLRSDIRNAVDSLLADNNPDFLDSTIVKSMIIIPSLKTSIAPAVFMTVFQAWQHHEALEISYGDSRDEDTCRVIEPHVLVYLEGIWYVKGFCHMRGEERVFALHRIKDARPTGKFFEPDEKIIRKGIGEQIFETDNVKDAEIICDAYLKNIVTAKKLHEKQSIRKMEEDKYLLKIPGISEYKLVTWVLHQCGRATLLKPGHLREEIMNMAEKIITNHANEKLNGQKNTRASVVKL